MRKKITAAITRTAMWKRKGAVLKLIRKALTFIQIDPHKKQKPFLNEFA